MGSLAEVLPRIPGIYRSGEGLPYPEYGADCRLAIANFNRPMFVNDLAGWFAATPEVHARLAAEGARALDVGCGIGWSSISLAKASPTLRVDGIDSDEASIAEAQRLAEEAGVADRVRFRVVGAAGEGGYDAAFIFEALHDMARPVDQIAAGQSFVPGSLRVPPDWTPSWSTDGSTFSTTGACAAPLGPGPQRFGERNGRRRWIARASSRDTCIWLTPRRRPISDCVSSSK